MKKQYFFTANGKLLRLMPLQFLGSNETMTAYGHKNNNNHKQKYLPNRQMNEVSFIRFIVQNPEPHDDGK